MNACSLAGLLALALADLGRAQDPAPGGEPRTAAQWVAELESGSFAEARQALLGLGTRQALPALVACVADRPPAAGWRAIRVLRELPSEAAPDRLAIRDAAKSLARLAESSPDALHREIAVLAVGALGAPAAAVAKDLAARFGQEESAAVCLGSALALADLGKEALKPLQKAIEGDGVMAGTWALAALAMLGQEASGAAKAEEKLALLPDSTRAFLLSHVSLHVLERCSKPSVARSAAAQRRKQDEGRRVGGMIEDNPSGFLLGLTQILGWPAPIASQYSLPESFEPAPFPGIFTIGEGYRQLLLHLVRETEALRERMRSGELPELENFERASMKLLKLAEILQAVERLVAAE